MVGRSTVLDVGAADHARLADQPRRRRRDGHLAERAAAQRQGAGHDFDVRVGSRRRLAPLRDHRAARSRRKLTDQLSQLLPGETIKAESNGKNIVLSGQVSNKDMIERAVNLAAGYVDKKEEVLVAAPDSRRRAEQPGAAPRPVRRGVAQRDDRARRQPPDRPVRHQEQHRADDDGAVLAAVVLRPRGLEGQQRWGSDVTSASGKITFSDFLNVFLFNNKYDIGAVIKALQTKGLFQSLAEPNLVAESGKEASFLAGGEYPIPIAQGGSGSVAITVQYKEYGIRLNFTPIVNGNRVHLKVRPEVSTLDFANAIVLNGFRIPALSTRRTETEIELNNGQTFAVAGLMNNTVNTTMQKIPGIGDIPILGLLFQSKAAQKNQTELVVMITPEILPNNSTGVTSTLPQAGRTVHGARAAEEGRSSSRRRRSGRIRARA